jgi:hypothetical protein
LRDDADVLLKVWYLPHVYQRGFQIPPRGDLGLVFVQLPFNIESPEKRKNF